MSAVSMSEVKVGLMVVLSVVLIVALTMSLGNYQSLFANTATIHITIPSVVGLEPYAQVTYSGVRIGTVTAVRYDEQRDVAVIDARIDLDSAVSIDSEVVFTSAGLLSPLFIEIRGGSKNKRLRDLILKKEIVRDEIYLEAKPYASIGELFTMANDVKGVLAKVETVLDGLREPIAGISGFIDNVSREVGLILDEVNGLVVEDRPVFKSILDNADRLIVSASAETIPALRDVRLGVSGVPGFVTDTRAGVNTLLGKAGGAIDAVSPEVVHLSGDMRELVQSLKTRVETVERSLSQILTDTDTILIENRDDIRNTLDYLRRTMKNLDDLTDQLAKNPWRIIWKTEEIKPPIRTSPDWKPFDQ